MTSLHRAINQTISLMFAAWARLKDLASGVSPRLRRRVIGLAGALLVHALLLGALIGIAPAHQAGLGPSSEVGGQSNAFMGTALSPLLVSLAPRGDLGQTATSSPAALLQAQAAGPRGAETRPALVMATDVLTPLKAGDEGQTQSPSKDLQAAQADPVAAASVQGLNPQASVQGGEVEGDQNLLRQIARCLPAEQQPVIEGATLAIRLDRSGALAAAPAMDLSLAFASRETIADANLVIQAALQCGPYAPPGGAGADYALTPDFSFLKPQQIAVGDKGADDHGR